MTEIIFVVSFGIGILIVWVSYYMRKLMSELENLEFLLRANRSSLDALRYEVRYRNAGERGDWREVERDYEEE